MAVEAKDLAYLAGLIDGDGCILIRRRDSEKTAGDRARGISFVVLVKIGGEPNHISLLRDEFGGIGSLYIRKKDGQRHLAEWTIAGGQAIKILNLIVEFLRLKRHQAEIAISMPHPRSRWGVTQELRHSQELSRIAISNLNKAGRGKAVSYGG